MTATFDAGRAGTPESGWDPDRFRLLSPLTPPRAGDHLVVVAAHPDDESLGAGGLIVTASRAGASVEVIIASDGEASHPASPTHSPSQLAHRRRAEVTAAVAALAPGAAMTFLSLPDGALGAHAPALEKAVAKRLSGCTHVASPWARDRHPDHEACARAVRAALAGDTAGAEHWEYPIWAWHWAEPGSTDLPWERLRRLDLTPEAVNTKRSALDCHVSQHTELSKAVGDEAIVPPQMLAHFLRTFECFVVEATHPAAEAAYFDALYDASDDPWGLAERFYEKRKRELLLASLPRARFRRGFEPGCATGLLTEALAARCDELVAWDGAAPAVRQTRAHLGPGSSVQVEQRRIPEDWPPGAFDLVVLSEVGYYCVDLDVLAHRVVESLAQDGIVVACHWRHRADDHPHTADAVHRALGDALHHLAHHGEADFRIDVWSRTGRSVADEGGMFR